MGHVANPQEIEEISMVRQIESEKEPPAQIRDQNYMDLFSPAKAGPISRITPNAGTLHHIPTLCVISKDGIITSEGKQNLGNILRSSHSSASLKSTHSDFLSRASGSNRKSNAIHFIMLMCSICHP